MTYCFKRASYVMHALRNYRYQYFGQLKVDLTGPEGLCLRLATFDSPPPLQFMWHSLIMHMVA